MDAIVRAFAVYLVFLSWRFPRFLRIAQSTPMTLVKDGKPDRDAMRQMMVSEEDILASARSDQGLESMNQIKHVVLESSGGLSIIPKK